jgi:putative PIN family toxin of toxin-antitoxin system
MRLVVDANIWISTLLSSTCYIRVETFFTPKYRLIVSKELFKDLDSAIHKPYPAKRIVRAEYDKLVFRLKTIAELVEVHSIVRVCRDPKDNFLLALAKDGNADYLITGDADLLVLKEFGNTKIVTLSEFETVWH